MSSNLRRNKNRLTSLRLTQRTTTCPECGELGYHWIQASGFGFFDPGFWTCAKFYDPVTKRRLEP